MSYNAPSCPQGYPQIVDKMLEGPKSGIITLGDRVWGVLGWLSEESCERPSASLGLMNLEAP